MVEIEFTLTPEDLAAANKQIRPAPNAVWVIFVGFILLVIFPFSYTQPAFGYPPVIDNWLTLLAPVVIFFVVFLFVYRSLNNPKNILRGYKGWEDTIFDIPLTMRIEPDHLFVASKFGESKTKWPLFRKAHFTNDIVILYIGPSTFYGIPRRGVTRGDIDAFVGELQKHIHPTLD